MEDKKDIFDILREESDNLTEVPPSDVWQRLETRLAKNRKVKRMRRPMELHIIGIVIAVLLLISMGAISWFVTFQHQERLRGQRNFAELRFLNGEWSMSDKRILDVIVWDLNDSMSLMGEKSLYFNEKLISKTPVTIKNKGKENILTFENQPYYLKQITNNTFIFISSKGQEVRLRKAEKDRFTISFGEGIIFVFNRKMP